MTDAVLSLPWLLAIGAVFCAGLLLLWKEARTAGLIIAQFFLTIGLPVVVILGALVWAALPFLGQLETGIQQAMIAGLVIAVGWLTTAIFAELAKSRGRAERLRDYHKALYAEIGNTLESLWVVGETEAYVAALTDRMEKEADYVPFIPREHHDHVYDAVIAEIDVLPRQTIDAIVAYYSLIKSVSALADDMRGETFKTLDAPRRTAMYSDYVGMRKQAYLFGKYALRLIKAYSDGGARAAQQIISSQGADLSATSQGSV
ncbi:hypothetical protein JQT66_11570 [Sulfitobacter mediterraneus]|uniref:hypothetical protein n=1 Tax=Sulfitobacter mediterraneus TaxID=83219 RepID=UPI001933B133|nr:hypothetical protein [Sulfitobacter mediterraneus]MBM1310872.1 hypothetical protein [Sulfitobacter mediterraneus]MBM1314756.1 hypothetical protein [Sulfitobacter mediterraneus]MBM1323116.1 hypothetical protein [Sulfitobacter mediterraneus]MBM1327028.1 hypothetical protein [Sulfitobacter mediterraneus]MBM1398374.1 hypothetical protein [Sulfitobacter mediterraneus]